MTDLIGLFLHVDEHLAAFVGANGRLVYGLLFAIVFAETGLVVMPFLPGDSLLFAAGALAGAGSLDLWAVALTLFAAAVLGDAVNYAVGQAVGRRAFAMTGGPRWRRRLLNPAHLARTEAFFARYGGKAIVLGRFVPIVRTFVPFVAGAASMPYARFALFNVAGAALWVGVCTGAGYLFGAIPFVQRNFEVVVVAIIAISVMPIVFEAFGQRRRDGGRPERRQAAAPAGDGL